MTIGVDKQMVSMKDAMKGIRVCRTVFGYIGFSFSDHHKHGSKCPCNLSMLFFL